MILFGLPLWIVLVFLFLLGATIGSFLNVCIHRIPKHDDLRSQLRALVSPPSTCPGCGTLIAGRDNVPIFGWLVLRGRCRTCRRRIAWRYPAIELLNALLFVGVYLLEVPSARFAFDQSGVWSALGGQPLPGSGWLDPISLLHWRYAYHMVLLEALLVATFIDFDTRLIPDAATLPALAVGVLGAVVCGRFQLVPVWFQNLDLLRGLMPVAPAWLHPLMDPAPKQVGLWIPAWIAAHPHWHGLAVSVAGIVAGGGLTWGVRLIGGWVLRKEAMGFGDVILMATIGAFLGWQPTIVAFFVAPLGALIVVAARSVVRRENEIPYGPYLSLAAATVLLGWRIVWPATQRIFELGPLLPFLALFMAATLVVSLYVVRTVKRALGFRDRPRDDDEWRTSDQLLYQAGENSDPQQGRWRTDRWPGQSAGTGRGHEDRWRGR